jgi:chitinase
MLIGYYPYWVPSYKANNIPYEKLTHIFHAFVLPTSDGSLFVPPSFIEEDLIFNAHINQVKVILSIGGANIDANINFKKIAASKELRKKFASEIKKFLIENEYDGVDLDWEFPESEQDKKNEVLLVKEIYDELNLYKSKKFIITKAAPAGDWFGRWVDYLELNRYIDFYNVMTYDFYGEWSPRCGHNAALYDGVNPDAVNEIISCESSVKYLIKRGVPIEKLVLGLPFYGHWFKNSNYIYELCKNKCVVQYMNYNEIYFLLKDKNWIKEWDANSYVPYLKGEGIITYDNEKSLREKVKWSYKNNLAGVFIWDISADFIENENKLLNEVYEELVNQCAK